MAQLVRRLQRGGAIRSDVVARVMARVDRRNYVLGSEGDNDDITTSKNNQFRRWYEDAPQRIPCAQTISAPHMHALALELMLPPIVVAAQQQQQQQQQQLNEQQQHSVVRVLDVGCGSGYLTACLGRLLRELNVKQGAVYGMDIHPELVALTRSNMLKGDGDLLLLEEGETDSGNNVKSSTAAATVRLQVGNGWLGWPAAAPFDAIHVGAAADVLPRPLAQQLRVGGGLVIPIGPPETVQTLSRVERIGATGDFGADFRTTRLLAVQYVPLVGDPVYKSEGSDG